MVSTKEKTKLRKFTRELDLIRGQHTELISVYIPAGYDIIKIIQHLQQEQGTAKNIKSKATRERVIDSLERIIRHLRLFTKTPKNGLAVFAGNASESENKIDIKVWSIEPPEPLNVRMYRCDQTFVTDILKGMMETKECYGLIVMDRREATVGILQGTSVKVLTKMTSGVPGKTRAGGQCCDLQTIVNNGNIIEIKDIKIGDQIEGLNIEKNQIVDSICLDKWTVKKDSYYIIKTIDKKIITSKDHIFFVKEKGRTLKKPAESLSLKDFLIEKNNITKITSIESINKPIELVDVAVKNGNFFANGLLVHNSSQRFARIREGAAKEFYKRISEAANKEFLDKKDLKGIIVGGPGPTKEEFIEYLNNEIKKKIIAVKDVTYTDESGLSHLVELSQDTLAKEVIAEERQHIKEFFETLAKNPSLAVYGYEKVKEAIQYGAVKKVLVSETEDDKIIDELEELAEQYNSEFYIISLDTQEGMQLKELSKVGAILRYPIK